MLRRCASCGASNRVPAARLHETAKCGRCRGALAASATPIDVTDLATFDDIIENAAVPVLVDFWAQWCGPCKMVAPEVAKVASQLAGRAVVMKVNTERLPYLAQRYQVHGIPNFAVFRGGQLVKQQAGAMRAADLARLLDVRRAA